MASNIGLVKLLCQHHPQRLWLCSVSAHTCGHQDHFWRGAIAGPQLANEQQLAFFDSEISPIWKSGSTTTWFAYWNFCHLMPDITWLRVVVNSCSCRFRQFVQFFSVMKPWWTVHPNWVLMYQIRCFIASWRDKGFQCYPLSRQGHRCTNLSWSLITWNPHTPAPPFGHLPFFTMDFLKAPKEKPEKTSAKKHTSRIHTSSSTPFFWGDGLVAHFPQGKKHVFSESSDLLDSLNPNVKKMNMCPTKAMLFIWAPIETHELSYKLQQPNL